MALALMLSTRLWLAGEVSEHRDLPLIRRLLERVHACARKRPILVCTDGVCSYVRAVRETFRKAISRDTRGRPQLRAWPKVLIAQVVKRDEKRRVVEVERRIVQGAAARVEKIRYRSQGDGVINTASIERLNATFRERLSALTRRGRALARQTGTLPHGMYLMGTVYHVCLDGGVERRVYELCRKHCGHQETWSIHLPLLYKKSGSTAPLRNFRIAVKKLAESNHLPDYWLQFNPEEDILNVYLQSHKGGLRMLKDAIGKEITDRPSYRTS